jgi:hypothetical protein
MVGGEEEEEEEGEGGLREVVKVGLVFLAGVAVGACYFWYKRN